MINTSITQSPASVGLFYAWNHLPIFLMPLGNGPRGYFLYLEMDGHRKQTVSCAKSRFVWTFVSKGQNVALKVAEIQKLEPRERGCVMGEVTKIAWCDHTFNPWIGCTRVSPGCQHCYAETQNNFHKWNGGAWGPGTDRRITSDGNWAQLRKWDRKAVLDRVRRRVFVASLADVFDAEAPVDARERLWLEIESCAHGLDFLLLTKRPENWGKYLPAHWLYDWPAHVRLGFTAEDQTRWEERAKIALDFRLTVRNCLPFFVSCEPLVGEIDLQLVQLPGPNQLAGHDCAVDLTTARINGRPLIGWVIVGGESGGGARPMHPSWARFLRDQCTRAGIPFFFKQWGEWAFSETKVGQMVWSHNYGMNMVRVGKESAGSMLDGREWMEFPK